MLRSLSYLCAILAWCCLSATWQACTRGCDGGGLQPVGHECAAGHGDAAADHAPTPGIPAAGSAACEHIRVMFPQMEPERKPVSVAPPPPRSPAFPWCWELPSRDDPAARLRIASPVDPPGPEPQRLLRLRVDILLI